MHSNDYQKLKSSVSNDTQYNQKIWLDLKSSVSNDTLELKPLYMGAQEYQRLMESLKKKKQQPTIEV